METCIIIDNVSKRNEPPRVGVWEEPLGYIQECEFKRAKIEIPMDSVRTFPTYRAARLFADARKIDGNVVLDFLKLKRKT